MIPPSMPHTHSRMIAARTCWLFGAVCLSVPLWSIWLPSDIPVALTLLTAALLVASAVAPVIGLFGVAVLALLAVPVNITVGGVPFGGNETAEAMVLAYLAGTAWRWTMLRPLKPGRLTQPAILLGLVVAASAITLLGAQQLGGEPLSDFLRTCWLHVTQNYFLQPRDFPAWHQAAVWIEALTLAVVIERVVHRTPTIATPLALVVAGSWAIEACFSLLRLGQIAARNPDVGGALWRFALSTRISPHFPDVNAVGSLFAVGATAWLVVLIGSPQGTARRYGIWLGALVMSAALWLTGSRAALGATGVVVFAFWFHRLRPSRRILASAVAAAIVAGLVFAASSADLGPRAAAATALRIRLDLADVGIRMVRDHPWFGVGISEFSRHSRALLSPEVVARFPVAAGGENAHNQLIQTWAELGSIGLVLFLWFWGRLLWPAFVSIRTQTASSWLKAWTAGLCAFFLSALLGHPFLTPYVVFAVFLVAGLTAGLTPATAEPRRRWPSWLVGAAALTLAATVPARITAVAADTGRLVIGASAVAGELDGVPYRVSDTSSSWFVRAPATFIVVPLRASAESGGTCAVDIVIDDVPANAVTVDAVGWRHIRFAMEPVKPVGSHRVDIRSSGDGCVLLVGPVQRQ